MLSALSESVLSELSLSYYQSRPYRLIARIGAAAVIVIRIVGVRSRRWIIVLRRRLGNQYERAEVRGLEANELFVGIDPRRHLRAIARYRINVIERKRTELVQLFHAVGHGNLHRNGIRRLIPGMFSAIGLVYEVDIEDTSELRTILLEREVALSTPGWLPVGIDEIASDTLCSSCSTLAGIAFETETVAAPSGEDGSAPHKSSTGSTLMLQ